MKLRRWLVSVGVVVLGAAALWGVTRPAKFWASAALEYVPPRVIRVEGKEIMSNESNHMDSEVQILRSRYIESRVVASLTPDERSLLDLVDATDPELLLFNRVSIHANQPTRSINITMVHRSEAVAHLVASRYATVYLDYLHELVPGGPKPNVLRNLSEKKETHRLAITTLRAQLSKVDPSSDEARVLREQIRGQETIASELDAALQLLPKLERLDMCPLRFSGPTTVREVKWYEIAHWF